MKLKKILSVAALTLMVGLMVPVSASAHGHGGSHRSSRYYNCTVENCTKTYNHKHNGKTYAAHHSNDGHSYHH